MSRAVAYVVLLIIPVILALWLGFCIGEDYGWRSCAKAYRRLMESA